MSLALFDPLLLLTPKAAHSSSARICGDWLLLSCRSDLTRHLERADNRLAGHTRDSRGTRPARCDLLASCVESSMTQPVDQPQMPPKKPEESGSRGKSGSCPCRPDDVRHDTDHRLRLHDLVLSECGRSARSRHLMRSPTRQAHSLGSKRQKRRVAKLIPFRFFVIGCGCGLTLALKAVLLTRNRLNSNVGQRYRE